jgi:hypothetical protein
MNDIWLLSIMKNLILLSNSVVVFRAVPATLCKSERLDPHTRSIPPIPLHPSPLEIAPHCPSGDS